MAETDTPPAPPKPPAPRTLDDWTATVAAAALIAGGFLVSIAGPMLRKLYDARRAELDELRQAAAAELVGHAAETDELGLNPDALDRQADAEAAADASYGTAEVAGDVWADAAVWQNGQPGTGAELGAGVELSAAEYGAADPAGTAPDGT